MSELPPDVQALLAAERQVPPAPAAREVVRAKLGASMGAAAGGVAALKILGLLLVVAAGVGLGVYGASPQRAVPPRAVGAHAAAPSVAAAPTRIEPAPPAPIAAAPAPAPAPAPMPPTPAAPLRPAAPTEAALLGAAWRALDANDADHALSLVTTAATRYPRGPLAEERDALEIQVLVRLGRADDARARATRFLALHPNSIHAALVERARDAP